MAKGIYPHNHLIGNQNGFKKGMIPWNKGIKMSAEHRKKLSEIHKKNPNRYWLGKERPTGENSANWHGGLEFRKKKNDRRDSAYAEWRRLVWLRDNFACKIDNPDCAGRIEAHHILSWRKFPELRYQINNGITLCRFHHPRKRDEEIKLSPYFQSLVMSNSN